jgi:hypothetical protein
MEKFIAFPDLGNRHEELERMSNVLLKTTH